MGKFIRIQRIIKYDATVPMTEEYYPGMTEDEIIAKEKSIDNEEVLELLDSSLFTVETFIRIEGSDE